MRLSKLWKATALSVALLTFAPAGAVWADDVGNNLDGSVDATLEVMNLSVGGGNGSVAFTLNATSTDAKSGCNLGGPGSQLVLGVSSNNPAVATVSASSVTLTACGVASSVISVHPVANGTATVGLTFTSVTTNSAATSASDYVLTTGSFTVSVTTADPCGSVSNPSAPVFNPDPAGPVDGNNGWFKTTPTVLATSSTAGTVITYSTDNGGTFVSTAPTLSDGTTTVIAKATDGSCSGKTSSTSATFKVDTTDPVITYTGQTPAANANGWNNTDVTLDWTCTDATSGVVSGADSETITTEGSNQSATGECEDNAGNTSTDLQSGINIDKTKPTLDPSVSPNPVLLNGSATASPGATDPVHGGVSSGIDTTLTGCDPVDTSAVGSFNVDCWATDNAGNESTGSASYTVSYGICGWDGGTVKAGATIPIKLYLCDADGNDVSSSGVSVTATSLKKLDNSATGVVEDSGNANPDSNFRYDSSLFGSGGYIFNLSTKSPSPALGSGGTKLATGTWKLSFSVGGVGGYSILFDVK